jgi:hypothetical protein
MSEIFPSYLGDIAQLQASSYELSLNDSRLRLGKIINIYPPDEQYKTMTYDVLVGYCDGGAEAHTPYYRVKTTTLFGGVADRINWIPRIDPNPKSFLRLNSEVLVMCVNGNSREAYIIGGIPHSYAGTEETYGNSIFLDFEYNGMNVFINEDGEFQLTRRGKTNADGSVADSEKHQDATYQQTINGEHILGYIGSLDDSATDNAFFKISKKDQNIKTYSKNNTEFKTDANLKITTANGMKVNPDAASQQAWLNGTNFRNQQQTLHTNLSTDIANLTAALTQATIALGVAAAANAAPMLGGVLALPGFGVMAYSLTQAITAVTKMGVDLANFEAQASTYLSTKHTHGD